MTLTYSLTAGEVTGPVELDNFIGTSADGTCTYEGELEPGSLSEADLAASCAAQIVIDPPGTDPAGGGIAGTGLNPIAPIVAAGAALVAMGTLLLVGIRMRRRHAGE